MIRALGLLRRRLCFTEQELDNLVDEFADHACDDIADLLLLNLSLALRHDLKLEIVHAIRSVIEELPHDKPSPAHQLRHAALETLGGAGSSFVNDLALATSDTPS